MTRKEVIEVCTSGGHTISKAIEIALDYERGDELARTWVNAMASSNWPLGRRA